MAQVGPTDAELQPSNRLSAACQRHTHRPGTTAERRARAECQSLLARLQAASGGDVRLLRVRHAIASGEFQVDARRSPNG